MRPHDRRVAPEIAPLNSPQRSSRWLDIVGRAANAAARHRCCAEDTKSDNEDLRNALKKGLGFTSNRMEWHAGGRDK